MNSFSEVHFSDQNHQWGGWRVDAMGSLPPNKFGGSGGLCPLQVYVVIWPLLIQCWCKFDRIWSNFRTRKEYAMKLKHPWKEYAMKKNTPWKKIRYELNFLEFIVLIKNHQWGGWRVDARGLGACHPAKFGGLGALPPQVSVVIWPLSIQC